MEGRAPNPYKRASSDGPQRAETARLHARKSKRAALAALDDWDSKYFQKSSLDVVPRTLTSRDVVVLGNHTRADLADPGAKRRVAHEYKQQWIQRQLSNTHTPDHLFGVDEQQKTLVGLLRRTITNRQNTCMILMGPRGCAKSTVLKWALRDVKKQLAPTGHSFVEVYLNGRIQTEDLTAMRSIHPHTQPITHARTHTHIHTQDTTPSISFLGT